MNTINKKKNYKSLYICKYKQVGSWAPWVKGFVFILCEELPAIQITKKKTKTGKSIP